MKFLQYSVLEAQSGRFVYLTGVEARETPDDLHSPKNSIDTCTNEQLKLKGVTDACAIAQLSARKDAELIGGTVVEPAQSELIRVDREEEAAGLTCSNQLNEGLVKPNQTYEGIMAKILAGNIDRRESQEYAGVDKTGFRPTVRAAVEGVVDGYEGPNKIA